MIELGNVSDQKPKREPDPEPNRGLVIAMTRLAERQLSTVHRISRRTLQSLPKSL
jgi:hypothetical protein